MKTCDLCGVTNDKIFFNQRHNINMCRDCRNETIPYSGELPPIYTIPEYGKVEYSPDGKPICHICGKAYNKLLMHVAQRHQITEKEYKKQFGLDLTKGITAQITKEKLQKAVKKHYDRVVEENLLKAGQNTRFKEGQEGRTIDKVSAQTMNRLKNTDWNGKFKKKDNSKD